MPRSTRRGMTRQREGGALSRASQRGTQHQQQMSLTCRRRCRPYRGPARAGNQGPPRTSVPRQQPSQPCSWRRTPSGARVSSPVPSEARARGPIPHWSPPQNPSRHRTSRSSQASPPSAPRRALQRAPPRSQRSRHCRSPAVTRPAQSKVEHRCWCWRCRHSRRARHQEPGRGPREPSSSAVPDASPSEKALTHQRNGKIRDKLGAKRARSRKPRVTRRDGGRLAERIEALRRQ